MEDLYILNTLNQVRVPTKGDPRLRNLWGQNIHLSQNPKIGAGNFKPGYWKSYDINAGDVVYYLDPKVDSPFPRINFSQGYDVIQKIETPMSRRQYITKNVPVDNSYSGELSWLRDSNYSRQDLMAKQQIPYNSSAPLTVYDYQNSLLNHNRNRVLNL